MDALGDRMKSQYENRTRYYLPRRTYTIVRVDGKAFHTLTRGMEKPFDNHFANCMTGTCEYLFDEMGGSQLAYVQSDEISVLLTDFKEIDTQAWFDGNLQKICSVSASIATAYFNHKISGMDRIVPFAHFDSRVFTISDRNEVSNYFVWRTRDAIRNSINMLGQAHFSRNDLDGKNTTEVQDMLMTKGINWNDIHPRHKTGCLLNRQGKIDIPKTELYNFYLGLIP